MFLRKKRKNNHPQEFSISFSHAHKYTCSLGARIGRTRRRCERKRKKNMISDKKSTREKSSERANTYRNKFRIPDTKHEIRLWEKKVSRKTFSIKI
jgi:hypothetical protein